MQQARRAEVTLPSDEEVLITREFDAPAARVFEAWTTPELVRRWWHANRGEVTVVEIDLRVGGRWRYAMLAHGEFEVAFHGEYREIVPGERLVFTEVYEGMPREAGRPDEGSLNTLTLSEPEPGRTQLQLVFRHVSRAARDLFLNSGMEDGLQDAMALLEQTARETA